MSKSINRYLLILTISCTCCFGTAGCICREPHHESNNIEWIQEQVKQGKLTPEQAQVLIEQERDSK